MCNSANAVTAVQNINNQTWGGITLEAWIEEEKRSFPVVKTQNTSGGAVAPLSACNQHKQKIKAKKKAA
jgi:hypothetical protein